MDMNIKFMSLALEQARLAYEKNEVPIGAVIVRNGEVISTGFNKRHTEKNAILHAETEAISNACKKLGGWHLWNCDLYVTVEPCPMCAGAIINSRIRNVYIGTRNSKFGACGSVINLFDYPFNHKPNIVTGIMEEECKKIMSDFFLEVRLKKKQEKDRERT